MCAPAHIIFLLVLLLSVSSPMLVRAQFMDATDSAFVRGLIQAEVNTPKNSTTTPNAALDQQNGTVAPPESEDDFGAEANFRALRELLTADERRALLDALANTTLSKADAESAIRRALAANNQSSAGTSAVFDAWIAQVRAAKEALYERIAANLSSVEALQLLRRLHDTMRDRNLTLSETCRRINVLLGRRQWANGAGPCPELYAKNATASESQEDQEDEAQQQKDAAPDIPHEIQTHS